MRLSIKRKTGQPVNLSGLKSAIFYLPYRGSRVLEAKNWTVEGDPQDGIINVELTGFEKSGLNEGEGQTFSGVLEFSDFKLDVSFDRQLNVIKDDNEEKQLCYSSLFSSR